MSAYESDHGRLDMATLLMLGFTCLLRKGELLTLTISDFSLDTTTGICSLRNTKSGKRDSANEFVSITDMITLELIRFRKDTNSGSPLWIFSGSAFRQQFRRLCEVFHIAHCDCRPYSLRRGGATDYFSEDLFYGSYPYKGLMAKLPSCTGVHVR